MNGTAIDPIELTRRLIAFDTVNPPGQERRCAEFLAEILSREGFATTLSACGEDRANLVATRHGAGAGAPLVFTGHLDVVPLGSRAWARDPFSGEIAGGRLYGRGASDMKSGIAAFVCAALRTTEDDDDRAADITMIITAGEETGCIGAAELVTQGNLGRAGAIIVGEPTANAVYVGHKGALWLNAVTTGVTAHGSMPQKGDNAIYKAARVIGRLESFSFGGASHRTLGAPTLNVGTVHGGINVNSVPDRAEIGIDIRTVPSVDHAQLRRALEAHVGEKASLEVVLDMPGVWTSPRQDWVARASRIANEVTGASDETRTATYFSDASLLTPAMGAPPTIILGPGEPAQAHQTDEWCGVDQIHAAVEIYRRLLADWSQSDRDRREREA